VRQPQLTDLHALPDDPAPRCDLVVPLFAESGGSAEPVGVVILAMKAEQFLYQVTQSWPASALLGVATGLLWAPCAGPILGLILTGAALNGARQAADSRLAQSRRRRPRFGDAAILSKYTDIVYPPESCTWDAVADFSERRAKRWIDASFPVEILNTSKRVVGDRRS